MIITNEDSDGKSVDPGEIYQASDDDEAIIYVKHGDDFKIQDNLESQSVTSDFDDSEQIEEKRGGDDKIIYPSLNNLEALRYFLSNKDAKVMIRGQTYHISDEVIKDLKSLEYNKAQLEDR